MAIRRIDDGAEFDIEYPRVRSMLLSALETSTNPNEIALYKGLLDRRYLLWVGEKSAAVTHNVEWDNQLVCQVYLAAGDLDEIINEGIDTISEWAKSKGCKGFVLMGRPGWKRVLEARDFKFASIVMFKEF